MNTGEPCSPYAVLALTEGGVRLGRDIAGGLQADVYPCKGKFRAVMEEVWPRYRGLICIMAAGIVVRTIAPLLNDKRTDPAVVVCDEKGRFAVSLVSGHLGGANALAQRTAELTGGQAVITTASDVLGKTPLDLWCRELGLTVTDKDALTRAMGKLVDTGSVSVYSRYPLADLPPDLIAVEKQEQADLALTCFTTPATPCLLPPKTLALGIGCKRDTPLELIEDGVRQVCSRYHLAWDAIGTLASITLKQDEPGLLAFARKYSLTTRFYSSDELNTVPGIPSSPAVFKVTGAKAVAEPAAILAAGAQSLLIEKNKFHGGITVAVAENPNPFAKE